MKRVLVWLPLVIVVVLGAIMLWGLNPNRDPNRVPPSPLIGKVAPPFDLPAINGMDTKGLNNLSLSQGSGLRLVNFFASWCVPCRAEHASLTELAKREGLILYGVNYKNKAQEAKDWLDELGNPYVAIGADIDGRIGIEWGVSGVPETFIISSEGVVLHHYRGPIVGATALRDFTQALNAARQQTGEN